MAEEEADFKQLLREGLKSHRFKPIAPVGSQRASVFMPLVFNEGACELLYEIRSQKVEQPGEICFPGGAIEGDETPEETAVRETQEELLVDPDQLEIISRMFRFTNPGGGDLYAVLGFINNCKISYDPTEVSGIFTIPIAQLIDMHPTMGEASYKVSPTDDFPFDLIPGGINYPWRSLRRRYYFYETKYGIIWGLTGTLTYNLLEELKKYL